MKITTIPTLFTLFITLLSIFSLNTIWAQEVEVQGSLKVTQMDADETGEELVIRNADGSLGTRSVATLPTPPPPIDSTRNLASDIELTKLLCDCPNMMPPFMIKKFLESGYTIEELIGAGIPTENVVSAQRSGILLDTRDNQSYKTVEIGDQVWMAENLNYGTIIDSSSNQTDNLLIEKYCYRDNPMNCDIFGGLYQWDELMQYSTVQSSQGICPDGWRIPSDDDWKTLEMHLGMSPTEADDISFRGTDQGSQLAGHAEIWSDGELKQNGVFGSSGFMALPGGYHWTSFVFIFLEGNFCTSSEDSAINIYAWIRTFSHDSSKIRRQSFIKEAAISVRCIKD